MRDSCISSDKRRTKHMSSILAYMVIIIGIFVVVEYEIDYICELHTIYNDNQCMVDEYNTFWENKNNDKRFQLDKTSYLSNNLNIGKYYTLCDSVFEFYNLDKTMISNEQHINYTNSKNYTGYIDTILYIPKLSIEKAVIRAGNQKKNLDNMYFITGVYNMTYNFGDYIILGHQSYIYGNSFNRLTELQVDDNIFINYQGIYDRYQVKKLSVIPKTDSINYKSSYNTKDKLYIATCSKSHEKDKPVIVVECVLVEENCVMD